MKKNILILSTILLFQSAVFSQQNERRIAFDATTPLKIKFDKVFTSEDTLVLQAGMNLVFSYQEMGDNADIRFRNLELKDVGTYTLHLAKKNNLNTILQSFTFKVTTPEPVITAITRLDKDGDNSDMLIPWKNSTEDSIQLEIKGRNFYCSEGYPIIRFQQGKNIYLLSKPKFTETSIVFTLDLSQGAKPGPISVTVSNSDGVSTSKEFVLAAADKPSIRHTSPIYIVNGQKHYVSIDYLYPYLIKEVNIYKKGSDEKLNVIIFGIDESKLLPDEGKLPLTVISNISNFNASEYRLEAETYDGDKIKFESIPFRITGTGPKFLPIERYSFQDFPAEKIRLSEVSVIYDSGDAFYMTCRTDTIHCIYLEEGVGDQRTAFFKFNDRRTVGTIHSGTYTTTHNGVTLTGKVEVLKWPQITSIEWEPLDRPSITQPFNGKLFATGVEQKYRVKLTFGEDLKLDLSKWKICGAPLTSVTTEGNYTYYDVTIPSTVKSGKYPTFEYQMTNGGWANVEVKPTQERIQEYSRPLDLEKGFITILGIDNSPIDFNTLSSNSIRTVDIRSQNGNKIDSIYVLINNRSEFKAGTQKLTITVEANGKSKSYERTIEEGAKIDSLLFPYDRGINAWDTISVKVEFHGDSYNPKLRSTSLVKEFYLYKKTRISIGTGFPISSTILYNVKEKDWIYSPLTFSANFCWDFMDNYGSWKGHSIGASVGVSSLEKLVDNEQKYFGLITCFYYETDLLKWAGNNSLSSLPLNIGLGIISESKRQVLYVNPTVTFSFGIDLTGRKR